MAQTLPARRDGARPRWRSAITTTLMILGHDACAKAERVGAAILERVERINGATLRTVEKLALALEKSLVIKPLR